jgi:hypothetical protein
MSTKIRTYGVLPVERVTEQQTKTRRKSAEQFSGDLSGVTMRQHTAGIAAESDPIPTGMRTTSRRAIDPNRSH